MSMSSMAASIMPLYPHDAARSTTFVMNATSSIETTARVMKNQRTGKLFPPQASTAASAMHAIANIFFIFIVSFECLKRGSGG